MGIATTPFRPFNAPNDDPLEKAFRCNGNAQCLSYAASVPMCPSFKATWDVRHSPKGWADAQRAWHEDRRTAEATIDEADLLGTLDTCLGSKACSTTCPVQVDIPAMRAAFYADLYTRKARPLADRAMLLAERLSPLMLRASPVIRPFWPLARRAAEAVKGVTDLPADLAQPLPRSARVSLSELKQRALPERAVLVWMDWFSALYDGATQRDVYQGLTALGYVPLFVEMLPAGKVAGALGDRAGFAKMAGRLVAALSDGGASGAPMIGLDPAFVMALRLDIARRGSTCRRCSCRRNFLRRRSGPAPPDVRLVCREPTQLLKTRSKAIKCRGERDGSTPAPSRKCPARSSDKECLQRLIDRTPGESSPRLRSSR